MKNILIKVIMILIIFTMSIPYVKSIATAETQALEAQKDKINKQIEEITKKQEEIENQKSATMKTVQELITKISNAEQESEILENKIRDLKSQIKSKERDIEQKEQEYTEQGDLLNARLIAIYENGQTSYLDVLLTSSSMTDFLAKYNAASELIEYDKQLMKSIKEQKEIIQKEKETLEESKKELDTSLAKQKAKETELKSMKSEKQAQADKLTAEEKKLQAEIEELEATNRSIQNQIKEAERKYQQQLAALQAASGNVPTGTGYFRHPVSAGLSVVSAQSYYASSKKFHGAIDYAVSPGTTVMAAADGVVMATANLTSSYGTYIVIRHANGMQTYYAHGTKGSIVVKPGQTVKKGEKIMLSGNTGNSTGPHLHFEVRVSPYSYSYSAKAYGQDSRVNPLNYL